MRIGDPITILMITYNQEKYVKETLQSLIVQDYENFSIVISDDASTDRTAHVIASFLEKLDDSVNVSFRRGDENLGIADHINEAIQLVDTRWVVLSSGDDVSLSNRVSKTVKAIVDNPNAFSVYFNTGYLREDITNRTVFVPNIESHSIDKQLKLGGARVFGPSHAFKLDVFDKFGNLPSDAFSEDRVIPFRSALLGKIVFVNEVVVNYRLHYSSISTKDKSSKNLKVYREYRLRPFLRTLASYNSFFQDLETAHKYNLIDEYEYAHYMSIGTKSYNTLENYIGFWHSKSLGMLFRILYSDTSVLSLSKWQMAKQSLIVMFPIMDYLYHVTVRRIRLL